MGAFKDWLLSENFSPVVSASDTDPLFRGLEEKFPEASLWQYEPAVIKMIARTKRNAKDGKTACSWFGCLNDDDKKLINTIRCRLEKKGAYRRAKKNGNL